MIEEQQRHQYLEALGISSWLPRNPLVGAPESAAWVWDFSYPAPEIPFSESGAQGASAASRSVASAPSVPANPAAARAMLSRSFADTEAAPAAADTPAAAVLSEAATSPAADLPETAVDAQSADAGRPQPRFKLVFAGFGPVLIVDSLPPQAQGGFSATHQRLAAAVARSLSLPDTAPGTAPFMLPWPMFASPTLPQGYGEALLTVQHKLKKALEGAGVRAVLLLGESAAQMCLERDEPLDELRGILFSLPGGVKAVACHSLTEAMHLPGIKAQIWRDLQPLIGHLNAA